METPLTILVEACVDGVESAVAAQAGGAGRVELCANLLDGGTTPSAGTIAVARERLSIPLFVLIRPRGGDFLYSDDELEVMRRDVDRAKALGADGVVLGALTAGGDVDVERTRALVERARPMRATFHRAFDLARDPAESLEAVVATGAERVLTSGAAPTALEGLATIAALVRQAEGRLTVLAGGGITEESAPRVAREGGVREIHLRGSAPLASPMRFRRPGVHFGKPHLPDEYVRTVTDAGRIRRIVESLGRDGS